MNNGPEVLDLLSRVSLISRQGSVEQIMADCTSLLGDATFQGKRVLEIGCGGGQLSLLMAAGGASQVVGLEPMTDGANPRSVTSLNWIRDFGEIENLEIRPEGFDERILEKGKFDVILGVNVINHLHETELHLKHDKVAREYYLSSFRMMREILNPGGVCIFTDAGRRNAWRWLPAVGIPHPFSRTIEWQKHQQPSVWGEMFLEAGFSGYSVEWQLPCRFGITEKVRPPRLRALLAWLWTSFFILRVRA